MHYVYSLAAPRPFLFWCLVGLCTLACSGCARCLESTLLRGVWHDAMVGFLTLNLTLTLTGSYFFVTRALGPRSYKVAFSKVRLVFFRSGAQCDLSSSSPKHAGEVIFFNFHFSPEKTPCSQGSIPSVRGIAQHVHSPTSLEFVDKGSVLVHMTALLSQLSVEATKPQCRSLRIVGISPGRSCPHTCNPRHK